MKLWEYSGKRIKITAINGQVFEGYGDHYTSELDNPDGIPTLSLDPDNEDGMFIEFSESEIAKIETLPSDIPITVFPAVSQKVV